MPKSVVEEVQQEAKDKLGFLCGALDNYDELRTLFNGIIALYVDDDILKSRLSTRSPREWGTQEHELRQTLERHHIIYDKWRGGGAVIVNTSSSQEQVVNEVIGAAKTLSAYAGD